MKGRRAFTLVELLAIIAIIAILAAMIFPVFAKAREAGRRTVCQANLKQIASAFTLYLNDWRDTYPCNTADPAFWMGRKWRWPLVPYVARSLAPDAASPNDPLRSNKVKTVFLCPSDAAGLQQFDGTSYAYSASFFHEPSNVNRMVRGDLYPLPAGQTPRIVPVAQRASAVLYPAQKILAGEWTSNHQNPKTNWWTKVDPHAGARVYAFADGHVAYVPSSKILPSADPESPVDVNLTKDGINGRDID